MNTPLLDQLNTMDRDTPETAQFLMDNNVGLLMEMAGITRESGGYVNEEGISATIAQFKEAV